MELWTARHPNRPPTRFNGSRIPMPENFETEPSLELMRRIVAEYDAREGRDGQAEFLAERHITPGIVRAYRRLLEIIDSKKVSAPTGSGGHRHHGRRNRNRRIRTGPPGHPGTSSRPSTNRRPDTRVTVIIIDFNLP
ncbi:hypothetical protein [Streptomyces sp. NPDC058268]|uniref:hypothetical protein n=1 Tax=Streptomyces sp. NPDC058268 TaxID=3346413 RepID=UPI0036EA741B